jgi:serine/threonine protein kinase/HEAT repeat protein
MDELLPVLVSRLPHRGLVAPVVEAALGHRVVWLPLDEAPSYDGPHALEVHLPAWKEPLLLIAEPAGAPNGAQFPLMVKPFNAETEGTLLALLSDLVVTPASPPAEVFVSRVVDVAGRAEPPSARPPAPSLPMIDIGDIGDIGFGFAEEIPLPSVPPSPSSEPAPPPPAAPDEAAEPASLTGRVLGGGKYAIEEIIGTGGMGSVYLARHLMLDKAVAVKALHATHQHNEDFLAAFHREALAASRLDHPNVVQVLDFGQEPDGLLYIVMELLAGRDLRAVLDEQPVQPLARIVDLMTQVSAALSASHAEQVVHRDVKPENIILVSKRDDDGTVRDVVKVCDFGIAEILGKRDQAGAAKSIVSGTPDYMAPEQVRGGAIDARTDVYACGVILYEMATGKVPFHAAETPEEIAWMHLEREPLPPSSLAPGVDRHLEAVILKAMKKDPAARHQSARELRVELRSLADGATASRRLAAPDESYGDLGDILPAAHPSLERDDAIDIEGLFSDDAFSSGASPAAVVLKDPLWVLVERQVTALTQDAPAVLAALDAAPDLTRFAREMSVLEQATNALGTRGATAALEAVMSWLVARARGSEPNERTREGIAAKALRALDKPELCQAIAEQALDGPPQAREPARKILVVLGAPGAAALVAVREHASARDPSWPGRPRFVAAMRELGAAAKPSLERAIKAVSPRDTALIEDLLRSVIDAPDPGPGRPASPVDEALGAQVSAMAIRHESLPVRRAALTALSAVWGARANPWLVRALEEPDDGVRIAAFGALRRHGGVDLDMVRRIERLLSAKEPPSIDLRVAAVAALGDTVGPARAAAVETLTTTLRPPSGFLSKLVTTDSKEDPLLPVTMARVLLSIGGPEAVKVVEARAARSAGDLKRQLQDLLRR